MNCFRKHPNLVLCRTPPSEPEAFGINTSPVTSTGEVQLRPGDTLPCGIKLLECHHEPIFLSSQDHLILKRSAAALRRTHGNSSKRRHLDTWKWPDLPKRKENLDWDAIAHFINPSTTHLDAKKAFYVTFELVLSSVAYSGIHLLSGWNFNFPSFSERLLWNVSCSFIIAVLLLFPISASIHEWNTRAIDCGDWKYQVYDIWVRILVVAYLGARTFIVVESFISLRHVPIGVYWTPPWLQVIPHV